MEPIISLENVVKQYGKKTVLENFNLKIYKGDRIAYLGGNGSGKTTTVEIIAKIKKPTGGKVYHDPNLKIGIQLQDSVYPLGITARNLIKFYLQAFNYGSINDPEIQQKIKLFRLEKLLDKNISSLSGGQKQRINILLALVHEPNFLILDELSTGLDIKIRREIRKYIVEYLDQNPECSLILVTHNVSEALQMCNKIIFLEKGKIIVNDTIENIVKKEGTIQHYVDSIFDDIYSSNDVEEKPNLMQKIKKLFKRKDE
ncbi:ABC transporter ATP-binding protein [Candidatus Mycoplasma pogonae]